MTLEEAQARIVELEHRLDIMVASSVAAWNVLGYVGKDSAPGYDLAEAIRRKLRAIKEPVNGRR